MKKTLVTLFLSVTIIFLTACGDSFDEEGFAKIKDYASEMIVAIDFAYNDIRDGNGDTIDDYAAEIKEINFRHFNDDFPGEEIQEWMIKMTGGGQEWTIEGEDLYNAVYDLHWNSDLLADVILDNGDVERVVEIANETAKELRLILYN